MASLPYISTPGNIDKALNGIKSAATPQSVSQDFVKTILQIPSGSGNQMTSYLRKIGFTSDAGAPSEIYKRFRNSATEGAAAAAALAHGYKPLFTRNEYMYKLADDKLKGLIVEETGWAADATQVGLTLACIKQLKKFANWDAQAKAPDSLPVTTPPPIPVPVANQSSHADPSPQLRMQLGYTINLNLPATSDVAVFNAIFKSLKEHLLKSSNE